MYGAAEAFPLFCGGPSRMDSIRAAVELEMKSILVVGAADDAVRIELCMAATERQNASAALPLLCPRTDIAGRP